MGEKVKDIVIIIVPLAFTVERIEEIHFLGVSEKPNYEERKNKGHFSHFLGLAFQDFWRDKTGITDMREFKSKGRLTV